jgi:hypothetical protein
MLSLRSFLNMTSHFFDAPICDLVITTRVCLQFEFLFRPLTKRYRLPIALCEPYILFPIEPRLKGIKSDMETVGL